MYDRMAFPQPILETCTMVSPIKTTKPTTFFEQKKSIVTENSCFTNLTLIDVRTSV